MISPAVVRAQGPIPAGRSPAIEASVGYAYGRMDVPDSDTIGMHGADIAFTADFWNRIGLKADFSYLRSAEALGSDHHNDALTYMGGPVFYLLQERQTNFYVQGLFGGARLSGVNHWQYGGYLSGFVNRPAWSLGGGAQRAITPSLSLRMEAGYLRANFFDHTAAIRATSNLRVSVSVVYVFARGRKR